MTTVTKKRGIKQEKGLFAGAGVLFVIAVALELLAREANGFGEWYAQRVYPLIVESVGRITGLIPAAFVELLIYLLMACGVWYIVRNWKAKIKILAWLSFFLSALFFLFTVNCGINYYRKPFSSYSGLELRNSSGEELENLCLRLTDIINEMCANGITEEVDLKTTRLESVKAMKKLGTVYQELSGFYPPPKPLIFSRFFSVQQLCGQYSPFTVEATYNRDMPDYNIPHTVCHELSHLRGFMREDEANFIGYLACIGSEQDSFRYSGYLSGWIYASNALAKTDYAAYERVCKRLDERAWADLRFNNEYWAGYEGKAAEVSNQINDTYLKMNSQPDGVKSYGRVVDLMLAYERSLGLSKEPFSSDAE